jgi:hypothetical protein
MRLTYFPRLLLLVSFMVFLGGYHTMAYGVTAQQLDVIRQKDANVAELVEKQQQSTYERLDTSYHQKVNDAVQGLPVNQKQAMSLHESQLPTSIKNIREANLDASAQQVQDLNLLWQAAVYRSQPIRYAIEKLSNKDASGAPVKRKTMAKKALNSVAQLGGAAATLATASPVGIISGAFVSDVLAQTNSTTHKPVTDADMVILARAVEALQTELIGLYTEYRQALEQLELLKIRQQALEADYAKVVQAQTVGTTSANTQATTLEQNTQTRMLLRLMVDQSTRELKAADEAYALKRHALGLKVGPEALALLETPRKG